jgi:streptomycin 6-kinase
LQNEVLVHGDAHNGNILQVETSSERMFKFIDPDGLIAEPAYDLGVLMREGVDELVVNPVELGYKRSIFLGELTNVEQMSIREWGYIQAVATGLLLIKIGEKSQGIQLLDIASEWNYGFQNET